jgi:hypothetical protein
MSPIDFYSIIKTLPVGQSGFPTKKAMSEATGLNIWNVKLFLKGLVKSNKIRMEGNWYKFNEDIKIKHLDVVNDYITVEQAKDYIEAITEENKLDPDMEDEYDFSKATRGLFYRDKINHKNKLESFTILRWIMLIIGLGSSVISAYYTQIWQHETLNVFWSWFLSLIMIGFSSAAFLTLIGLLTKSIYSKLSTWLMVIVFFILWIICLIYSIQATVAGRFNQYQEIVLKNQVLQNDQNINKVKVNNLLENINSLKEDKASNQKQLEVLLNQYDYSQLNMGVEGETFQTIQNKISKVQGVIENINSKLENKNLEYEKILENSNTINTNESKFGFYDWAAKVYKTDRGNVEWIFILFPSLFLDIASPIALAVFMFLGRRKENV